MRKILPLLCLALLLSACGQSGKLYLPDQDAKAKAAKKTVPVPGAPAATDGKPAADTPQPTAPATAPAGSTPP